MTHEIYEAPKSELVDGEENRDEFYVVSITKFSVLFITTIGMYSLYWFYKNWALYKSKHNKPMWQMARAIFSIFFTHALFSYVDTAIRNKRIKYKWSPELMATLYVIFVITGRVCDRLLNHLIGMPYTIILFLLMTICVFSVLAKSQLAINVSQSDKSGSSNSRFTLVNYIWCVLGLLLWFSIVVGILGNSQALSRGSY